METDVKSKKKLFDIKNDIKGKVFLLGCKDAKKCLELYNLYLGSPSMEGLSSGVKEHLMQGIFLGSYDVSESVDSEEHNLTSLGYNLNIELENIIPVKKFGSAIVLVLAESYRMAYNTFEDKGDINWGHRSKVNITSFLLCTLYSTEKESEEKEYVPWDRGLCEYYINFVKKYWIPAIRKISV
jgi:hypothetical protein